MRSDAVTSPLGSNLILGVTVMGITVALLGGGPLLESAQARSAQQIVGQEFVDLVALMEEISAPDDYTSFNFHLPGTLLGRTFQGGGSLGIGDGTSIYLSWGTPTCALPVTSWNQTTIRVVPTCAVQNTSEDCALVINTCLVVERLNATTGQFAKEQFALTGANIQLLDPIGASDIRIRILDITTTPSTELSVGRIMPLRALEWESGFANVRLEGGQIALESTGSRGFIPNFEAGEPLKLYRIQTSGSTSGAGDHEIQISAGARSLSLFRNNVQLHAAFQGSSGADWCRNIATYAGSPPLVDNCTGRISSYSQPITTSMNLEVWDVPVQIRL